MTEKHYYATGRGGSGNIKSSDEQQAPHMVKQGSQTPNLLQPVFSTGRGGAGNMFKNTDSKLSRKMQDVDPVDEDYISPVLSADKNMSIGRGGFGNMISPKNSLNAELSRSKSHKSSHTTSAEKEKSTTGFFGKAKSLFKKNGEICTGNFKGSQALFLSKHQSLLTLLHDVAHPMSCVVDVFNELVVRPIFDSGVDAKPLEPRGELNVEVDSSGVLIYGFIACVLFDSNNPRMVQVSLITSHLFSLRINHTEFIDPRMGDFP
ncbi:hypothetical protein WICPIJ_006672 [Wickerhamomyces pijperi]|uniref:Uncharacterized protein n=1 Tax=Wickerhamomyces pijperi TaxID=599730 RepID=A0A9P8Q1P1_WICPI|nr:hypothetical protein WICPIJ_006672 [Wickerhamomyces pijperi]